MQGQSRRTLALWALVFAEKPRGSWKRGIQGLKAIVLELGVDGCEEEEKSRARTV